MKIVLDTNVLVSSLISTNTPPDLLYQAWDENIFDLLTSKAQIEELIRVFNYPHLRKIIPTESSQKLLDTIVTKAIVIEVFQSVTHSPDPADNTILAIALTGKADFIVSGDKRHMLKLKRVENIPIFNARDALKWIYAGEDQ